MGLFTRQLPSAKYARLIMVQIVVPQVADQEVAYGLGTSADYGKNAE